MRRRALNVALAAAIGLIALSLLSGAAAGDSGGSAGPLTHHFPLGTQTLSRSTTAAAGGSTTTAHQTSAAAPPRPATEAPARRQRTHSGSFPLALLGLIPLLIAVALLSRAVIRSSRRLLPRGRHEISPALERLLSPLFRYDPQRYAWVLRGIGRRFGPVFRRRPPVRVTRGPDGIMRSTRPGARWSYEYAFEPKPEPEPEPKIERAPPPLPIRAQSTVSRARPAPGPSAKPHTPREQ